MLKISITTILLSISSFLVAQEGRVFDNLTLTSKILNCEKKYAVYLPPDYETSQRSYPVLYLLHGGGGNQTTWIQHGNLLNIADECINNGEAIPMIIVMPDASHPVRGWRNDPKGEWRYEDFFIQEFIPFIEYRSIAELSGGGNGSFTYALHHPELFATCCPLSPATFPLTIEEARDQLPARYAGITDEEIRDYYYRHSIIEQINKIPEDKKSAVRWYIETGDDDPFEQVYEGNCLIHIAMRKKGIPHEFRVSDGAHTWTLWRSALPTVLEFVSFP
jgi:enterochelin esterase-like enzyme